MTPATGADALRVAQDAFGIHPGCRALHARGTLLAGTGRSSTGKIGAPVMRSSTYSMPDFPVWMTAGMLVPLRRTVTSAGGEALSKSQRSWCTVWKCHTTFPVEARNATIELA